MREFNVTGICLSDKHYMVNIENKINEIMGLIHRGKYFTITRARQFGKTTILNLLRKTLPQHGYTCILLSFEGVGDTMFSEEKEFCQGFLGQIAKAIGRTDKDFANRWEDKSITNFIKLSHHIDILCKDKKIVLMIDEVDKASENRTFIHFLGMLRNGYLEQQAGDAYSFCSVILVGVYDIKNIKLKLINEERDGAVGRTYNSPWNIAADFNVDLSFNPTEIATMLCEYELEHKTGMDVNLVANELHKYTSGYPFLVSRICKCIDEEIKTTWAEEGVREAVNTIVFEKNVLFDDIIKNLENHQSIYDFLYSILMLGDKKQFVLHDPVVEWCNMFGYIKSGQARYAVISNIIFEIILSRYFTSKDDNNFKPVVCNGMIAEITDGGKFNMELCLRRFAQYYSEIYTENDMDFYERHGRLLFLSFLKPLINGHGFFHIESQFTDHRRMDIVVDYGRDQFIIELKLWRGDVYQTKAYDQLIGYMVAKGAAKGYMVTFDLRKEGNKKQEAR